MNTYCKKECPDYRSDSCALPSRAVLLAKHVGSFLGDIGDMLTMVDVSHEGLIATDEIFLTPKKPEVELRVPEVAVCIEQHQAL